MARAFSGRERSRAGGRGGGCGWAASGTFCGEEEWGCRAGGRRCWTRREAVGLRGASVPVQAAAGAGLCALERADASRREAAQYCRQPTDPRVASDRLGSG